MQTLTRRTLLAAPLVLGASGWVLGRSGGGGGSQKEDSMLDVLKAQDRGVANHGWLDSRHTFSFADYYNPQRMGFRALRVINEDRVAAAGGFPTHPHRDMEIISYVLAGALAHKDSMGNGSIIKPGDVQRMSAGSGVFHSEHNASQTDPVHFLQIWIMPGKRGIAPGYEQKMFGPQEKQGALRLVASPDGAQGSVTIHADARLYASVLGRGESVGLTLAPGRGAWLHVARGQVEVNGTPLAAGDAVSTQDERELKVVGVQDAEVLLFDLA
jgi:redox-sensitive bicupin YhaK (pirin superfamily)